MPKIANKMIHQFIGGEMMSPILPRGLSKNAQEIMNLLNNLFNGLGQVFQGNVSDFANIMERDIDDVIDGLLELTEAGYLRLESKDFIPTQKYKDRIIKTDYQRK